jgi:superfamily II DNA helicase RecQ
MIRISTKITTCKILVIQPLISLMRDQTKKLNNLGIKVCRLHSDHDGPSTISDEEIENSLKDCSIIQASPEAVINKHRIVC